MKLGEQPIWSNEYTKLVNEMQFSSKIKMIVNYIYCDIVIRE